MNLRLLFDECMSPSLASVAHERGLAAAHVVHLGLMSEPDHRLIPTILAGDWTLVTNNRNDFVALFRDLEVHAGLLVILPSVPATEQRRLLTRALDVIAEGPGDIVNQLVEVTIDGVVTITSLSAL